MKYILLASLLSSAVLAAPYAQPANAARGQRQGAHDQQGQIQAQGVAQGQNGAQGQAAAQDQAIQGQAAQGQAVQGQAAAQGQAVQGQAAAQGQAAQGQAAAQAAAPPAAGAASATPQDLPTAVSNWQADTSMVTNFLNTGAAMTNDTAFKAAALVAFNAEVDELTHKAIIESQIGNDPNIQGANSTLAGAGAFQDVVDKLMIMSMMGRSAIQNIDLINQNRCVNVLPNIDAYFAATGSQSQAVRPAVCDQTGVAGGVQGNGATLLGQAPGTPQAAFDAAQQLAAGTGNGIVQNGAPIQGQGQQAQGQQAQGQQAQGQQAQGQVGTAAQGQAGAQSVAGQQAGAVTPNGQAGVAAASTAPTAEASSAEGTGATGAGAGAGAGKVAGVLAAFLDKGNN